MSQEEFALRKEQAKKKTESSYKLKYQWKAYLEGLEDNIKDISQKLDKRK